MSILDELNLIFREVFDDDKLRITDKTTASDIEDWDSLTHILLLQAAESRFKVRFSTPEIVSLNSVGDLVGLIERKGGIV